VLFFLTCILLQETIAHKLWLKAHGLLLKLHFVQEESCCQILLKADAFPPDLQFAAGDHCTQAVAEGIWAVAGVVYGQPLCPLQGCAISLCGDQSAADAEGRDSL